MEKTFVEVEIIYLPKKEKLHEIKNAFHISKIREKSHLDSMWYPIVNVNFRETDVYIIYRNKDSENVIVTNISNWIKKELGISIEEISSKTRVVDVAFARQLFHYLCFKCSVGSLESIGRLTDRDHSTVIHSRNTIINDLNSVSTPRKDKILKAVKAFGIDISEDIRQDEFSNVKFVNKITKSVVKVRYKRDDVIVYVKDGKEYTKPISIFKETYEQY